MKIHRIVYIISTQPLDSALYLPYLKLVSHWTTIFKTSTKKLPILANLVAKNYQKCLMTVLNEISSVMTGGDHLSGLTVMFDRYDRRAHMPTVSPLQPLHYSLLDILSNTLRRPKCSSSTIAAGPRP